MWALLPSAAFLVAVIAHAILCRLPLRTDFVAKALLASVPVAGILAGLVHFRYGWQIETLASLLMYAFFIELYIFCFTLVSTSVSVSILLKVARHALSREEIEERYSDKSMMEGRVVKLVRAGFLDRQPDGFRVTGKARFVLAGFRILRFFFRHAEAKN